MKVNQSACALHHLGRKASSSSFSSGEDKQQQELKSMGASDVTWGGIPMILPSTLAMRYLHYERNIIPERCIEVGARYRTRRAMDENVRDFCFSAAF